MLAAERFEDRHIGPSAAEIAEMLAEIGAASLDDLIRRGRARGDPPRPTRCELPPARSEAEVLAELAALAERNEVLTSLIGMGYSATFTPPVILRNVLENPAWYTAYTPYQPEISQGRLEALLNFQTMVMDLCGMDIANASMLDEGTAAAEAMALCAGWAGTAPPRSSSTPTATPRRSTWSRPGRSRWASRSASATPGTPPSTWPTPSGCWSSTRAPRARCGTCRPWRSGSTPAGGLVVVAADLLALTLLTPPGELGADVVVGNSQRFGVPLGFGGPHAGFLATKEPFKRSLPGRLVGVSVDEAGRPALRLALQTREQHIRREKATSNICTAQVLLAVMASMYAVYHGPDGPAAHRRAGPPLTATLAAGLEAGGVEVVTREFFDTMTVRVPGRADAVVAAARERGINLRRVDADRVGIALDETTTPAIVGRRAGPRSAWPARRATRRSADGPTLDAARIRPAGRAAAHQPVPDPPGVPPPPLRDRDAALPAPAGGPGRGARPGHDPARLLHHEAERHHRDGAR